MNGGFEVDGRNDLPIPYQKHGQDFKYYNGEEQDDQPSYKADSVESHSQSKCFCGL